MPCPLHNLGTTAAPGSRRATAASTASRLEAAGTGIFLAAETATAWAGTGVGAATTTAHASTRCVLVGPLTTLLNIDLIRANLMRVGIDRSLETLEGRKIDKGTVLARC